MTTLNKKWDGQYYNANHPDETPFVSDGLRGCFEYRYLGIEEATDGAYGAHVLRAVPGIPREDGWHYHELNFHMLYILQGWIKFEYEGQGVKILRKGSCSLQPPGIRHRALGHSDDLEMLEISSPAEIGTVQTPEFEQVDQAYAG